ncbi:unnamed protein product, partial [Rotaria magnacalcarata]
VLTKINLTRNQVGNAGVQYLADALQHYPTLVRLNLEENEIDGQGAQYLANVLEPILVSIND